MACATLQHSEERAHYLKYISLLNDGGKLVLLEKLTDLAHNNDIVTHLKQKRPTVISLQRQHVISDTQYELLYPKTGQVDPSKFDLTLLTFLLRNICGLNAKSAVWNPQKPPIDTDLSVEADVVRLRNWRNKIIGHPEKTELSRQEFEDHWSSLEKVLLSLGKSIPNLQSVISNLKSHTIDPIRETELKQKINHFEEICAKQLKQVQSNQDNLLQTQQGLQRCQIDMQEKQDALERTQTTMQETQKESNEENKKIEHRLSGVERKVDQCHKAMLTKTESETSNESIKRTLLDLYKDNFQQVPIYLPKPTWKHPVRELYVHPELKVVDHRGKRLSKEDPDRERSTNITRARDMFYTDGKLCRNIYTSGEPGTGKSTFCEHLVQLWCDAHTASDRTLLDEDETMMFEFQLLFYLNLRDVSLPPEPSYDELANLIHGQLELSGNCSKEDICGCLSDSSTLILMDSLDEMRSKRLPYRSLLNKSCIVTASRPWKLEALRSQLEGKVDKQIEIIGLTHESPNKLADNVVKILNKELSGEQNAEDFIQKVQHEGLQQFLSIPSLIVQMLSLWYDGEPFGNSQYEVYGKMIHHQILGAIKAKCIPLCEENSQMSFPICCKKSRCPCKNYAKLMWKVSRLAYHTLFGDNKEASLVFDHDVTESYDLSGTELEICLKIGILTQHRLLTRKVKAEKRLLSFLHKTNQEYFASNWLFGMATGETPKGKLQTLVIKTGLFVRSIFSSYTVKLSDPQVVYEAIIDLDRALELKKVLLFFCQMDKEAARVLSRIISDKADNDERVQTYRQSVDALNSGETGIISAIQDIILQVTQTSTKLFLSDIFINRSLLGRNINLRSIDLSAVKSLVIATQIDDATWTILYECRNLQMLALNILKPNSVHILRMLLMNIETLKTLDVQCLLFNLKLLAGTLDIWGLGEEFDLSSLGDGIANLLNIKQLTTLNLEHVNISHAQQRILVQQLSNIHNLQALNLNCLKCNEHDYFCVFGSLCDAMVHICHLNNMILGNLGFAVSWQGNQQQDYNMKLPLDSDNSVGRYLQKFTRSGNAKLIQSLSYEGLPNAPVKELLLLIQKLERIEKICLSGLDFGNETILLPSWLEKLSHVKLTNCTFAGECINSFIQSLPRNGLYLSLTLVTIRRTEDVLQEIREVIFDTGVELQWGNRIVWKCAFFIGKNEQSRRLQTSKHTT